jgi:hypothetical protein
MGDGQMAVAEKTVLVFPGSKKAFQVPRLVKRLVQISLSVVATSALMYVLMIGSNFLQMKTTLHTITSIWYAFVMRSDIIATSVLTATVTVLVVYWMRGRER